MIDQGEQPLYAVYQSAARALLPKIAILSLLASAFFLGVLLNISLLELSAQQETYLKTGALVVLLMVIIAGIIMTYKKSKQPYLFYKNRLAHGKKAIYYLNITNTAPQVNFADKMFKTYSIPLGKTFSLRYIPEQIQLTNYVQQLVEYSRKNQVSEN